MSDQPELYQGTAKTIKLWTAIIILSSLLISIGVVWGSVLSQSDDIAENTRINQEQTRLNYETAIIQAKISTLLDAHIKNHD